ncbi:MAG: LytTR family DNA-binding domain-containing protein [Bacillota bacterium]|nr:LytTR family DNA-binding domain-containing protein [Bacillota bacterium]
MRLKTLIVDDEYPARQELRYILSEFDELEVVGEAANGVEAKMLVEAMDYSVLFVDIQMPGMTGLELGEVIRGLEHPPAIIFVTAYDDYAVKAFEVDAVDYLLKPFSEERVRMTIDKITKYFKRLDKLQLQASSPSKAREKVESVKEKEVPRRNEANNQLNIRLIPAEKQGKTILIDENDIAYVFTEKDNVYVKTRGEKMLIKFSLKELENRLCPNSFFRTHRCYIVNLKKVGEIVPFFNGTYNLIVADDEQSVVPVSRTQAKKLKKILGM